jgi:hypothetical protein
MTVLLPGMTEDDQRVKISSVDNHQQGLLDSWKSKVISQAINHRNMLNNNFVALKFIQVIILSLNFRVLLCFVINSFYAAESEEHDK